MLDRLDPSRMPAAGTTAGADPELAAELEVVLSAAGRHQRADFPGLLAAGLAACAGLRHGCVVSSDSAAVSTLVGALELRPGDPVLVAAHLRACFVFPLLHAGLAPIFVDCLTPALTLDADALAEAAAAGARAAFVAAPWGVLQDLAPARSALAPQGCRLVLDATDCLSPVLAKSGMAAQADATIVSLTEGQSPLSTGEGGAILSDDRGLVDRAASYQRFADLEGLRLGINQKISSMQAALGLHRLDGLQTGNAPTRSRAQDVREALREAGAEEGPFAACGTFVTVRLPANLAGLRATRLPRAHRLAAAAPHARPCPMVDAVAEGLCAIPIHGRRPPHA